MMNGLVRRSRIFLPCLTLALAAPIGAQTSVTLTSPPQFPNTVEETTSLPQAATLQNVQTATLTITKIAVSGNFAIASGGTCPLSGKIAKGASCTILITFTPKTTGTLSGQLTVTDSATNSPQTATVTGSGILPVTYNPRTWSFGQVPLGETSAAETFTLTNNQSTTLIFTNITATPVANFAIVSNTCGTSIGQLSSCTVGVTFTPTVTGAVKGGKLTFADTASNSPQIATLTGTGVAAALESIAVTPGNDPSVYVGGTQQFTATGTYSNGTTKNLTNSVTWTSVPLGIASITSTGLATGTAAGTSTITAAFGSVTGNAMLTVVQLFAPTGSLNTARYNHSATFLNTGLVLVAGGIGPVPGQSGALGELASAELYSPGAGDFVFTGNLNTAREQHSATLLNSGTVLIAGGSGGDGELASAELYSPSAGTFAVTGNLNAARYEHTATALPQGGVLIAGGYGGGSVLASAELYNPATRMFKFTTSLNAARYDATATLLQNGQVLIAGGADENGPLSSAELFDPTNSTFTFTTGSLNVARSGATATLLNTGNVLIADGYNYLITGPLTSAEIYNPSTESFTPTGSEESTAWLGTATLLTNADVLAAGSALNSAVPELYNPGAGTFSATSGMITPRDLQTATLLTDGAVLMAGGHSDLTNTVLSAAELYEPTTLAPPSLSSIAITPSNPTLGVNGTLQLIATGTFSNLSTQQLASVVWTSSNIAAVTVTNDITNSGVVFGAAAGTAMINACTGTICAPPVSITVP